MKHVTEFGWISDVKVKFNDYTRNTTVFATLTMRTACIISAVLVHRRPIAIVLSVRRLSADHLTRHNALWPNGVI